MIRRRKYPILEFDPEPNAVIEPGRVIKPVKAPEHCVFCFFKEVLDKIEKDPKTKIIACERSEMGEHPVFEIKFKGRKIAVMHPGVGAPFAAALLEYMIAHGSRKFLACGSAGVLDKDIAVGHILIPESAVRDEGASYHYLPPSREVHASPKGIKAIKKILEQYKISYLISKTWTTDAFYRETPEKVKMRRKEGCLTVEMEAATFFAVAQFRKVVFAQLLYGGDDVSGMDWNTRREHDRNSIRERIFRLTIEACLEL
jgi:uridine phosphorylase